MVRKGAQVRDTDSALSPCKSYFSLWICEKRVCKMYFSLLISYFHAESTFPLEQQRVDHQLLLVLQGEDLVPLQCSLGSAR